MYGFQQKYLKVGVSKEKNITKFSLESIVPHTLDGLGLQRQKSGTLDAGGSPSKPLSVIVKDAAGKEQGM